MLHGSLAGNLILLSIVLLCLASFVLKQLYEVGPIKLVTLNQQFVVLALVLKTEVIPTVKITFVHWFSETVFFFIVLKVHHCLVMKFSDEGV